MWSDYVALPTAVAALAALIARRRLPGAWGAGLFVAGASVTALLLYHRWGWRAPGDVEFVWLRVSSALSALWAVCAWAARRDHPADRAHEHRAGDAASTHHDSAHAPRPAPVTGTAAAFRGGALFFGVFAAFLIIWITFEHVLQRLLDADFPYHHLPQQPTNFLALATAMIFWRMSVRDRLQPVLSLTLAALFIVWQSLTISGSILWEPSELLLPATGWRPAWWTWTLNMQAGMAATLVVAAWLRDRRFRRRRASAWPKKLERLLTGYPAWPGFEELLAMIAAHVLILAVYHAVRPGLVQTPLGWFSATSAMAAGAACFFSAYRKWNSNIAGLGLALLTAVAVTLAVMLVADDPAAEHMRRLPVLLNAAALALAVMSFFYYWLPGVWEQQLRDGVAWTTTGRLIGYTRRAGFMIAALGVLVAFNMTTWPGGRMSFGPDNTPARWIAGLAGLLLLAIVTGGFALKRRDAPLATLCVASLAGMVLFAFIRWPHSDLRGWIAQNAAVVLAGAALIVLLAAEWLPRTRAEPFAPSLWISAALLLPAAALLQCTGRLAGGWVRPLTFAILGIVYVVAGARQRRRLLLIPAAALFLACGALLLRRWPMDWAARLTS